MILPKMPIPKMPLLKVPHPKVERLSNPLWNIFRVLEIFAIGYELLLVGGLLPVRYLFQGDLVDCLLDGVQNVTQLRDETHMERVRNYCGLFAIPPNYVQVEGFDGELFVRIEPRNETFVESLNYSLTKSRELFNLKVLYIYLVLSLFAVVRLLVLRYSLISAHEHCSVLNWNSQFVKKLTNFLPFTFQADYCCVTKIWRSVEPTQMLACAVAFYNFLMVVIVKMYAFGQIILIYPSTLVNSLLTIPTFELESTILKSGTGLKEQSDLALRSNGLRYLNKHLREFLILFTEAHRLLWSTVLGVLIISFFLKVRGRRFKLGQEKPTYKDDNRSVMIEEKSEDGHRSIVIVEKSKDSKSEASKSEDPKSEASKSEASKSEDTKSDAQMIPKRKPLSRIWYLYNLAVITCLGSEFFFILFYGLFMIVRYVAFDGMVDCVMDGLQNVTQLRNESYLEEERTYCARYGIPSNYGKLGRISSDLFIRKELRNQTFLESVDYFWGKQRELFNFRMSCLFLIQIIVFSEVSASFHYQLFNSVLNQVSFGSMS